jgi:hypothetical protein
MSKFILVSFCNLPTVTISPLLCLQVSEKPEIPISCAPVSLGYPELVSSAVGLARSQGKIFVLFMSLQKIFYVAVLQEEDLSPLYYQELPEVKDGHSLLVIDNLLYVVSTGTDEVICYNIKETFLENSRVVWQAGDTKSDTHHLNSMVEYNGEILVSAFGPKAGQLWSTASNGYIYNISNHSLVVEGLYHPHSLSVKDGKIYYSDSHRNSFCVVGKVESVFDLGSYTRGIAWLSDDLVCMATSVGRRVSKSTGLITNPADPGEIAGDCKLFIGNIIEKKIINVLDLSWFGAEVYDILVLPNVRTDLLKLANLSYKAERDSLQYFIKQYVDVNHQLDLLGKQHKLLNTQLVEQREEIQLLYQSISWRITYFLRKLIELFGNKEKK